MMAKQQRKIFLKKDSSVLLAQFFVNPLENLVLRKRKSFVAEVQRPPEHVVPGWGSGAIHLTGHSQ
jgi:hypothetical protein